MELFGFLFLFLVLIFSVVIHELSHGLAANYLGDFTPKYAGRLTLNPLKHLDPIGSFLVPFFLFLLALVLKGGIIFGWAKPVPINPYNLRDQKYGEAKVAVAGPLSNIFIALVFGLTLRILPDTTGSIFLDEIIGLLPYIVWVNLLLALFNLLPIPPLDGSHILFTFLGPEAYRIKIILQRFGLLILILLLYLFFSIILAIVKWVFEVIVGQPFAF